MTSESVYVRPDWDEWFLSIAKTASNRGDCRRRRVGAVLVRKDRSVAALAYNGHEPGGISCLKGECPRGLLSVEQCAPGSSYDTAPPEQRCNSLHAENNAILRANESTEGMTLYVTHEPCAGCQRVCRAARLSRIVWPEGELCLS